MGHSTDLRISQTLSLLLKGIGGLIGLGAEAHKKASQSKLPQIQTEQGSPSEDQKDQDFDESDATSDEECWARDETQQQLRESESPITEVDTTNDFADRFLRKHWKSPTDIAIHSASVLCPVIIPRRRPQAKARGFVTAYAPVLADSRIDEAGFLEFLDGFGEVIKVCCRKIVSR